MESKRPKTIEAPNTQHVHLPKELARYVSAEQMNENIRSYPEMNRELTELQKERVKKIKEVLKQIPLWHATNNDDIASGNQDLLPYSDLPAGLKGHSYQSDKSLGLTNCVFFHWGLPEKTPYGKHIVLVSSELLETDQVFVTPEDIGQIVFADEIDFEEYKDAEKIRISERYFRKIVSGRAWMEIVARQILTQVEEGDHFVRLYSKLGLGEVKHVGMVSRQFVQGSLSRDELKPHYRFLYEHGFSFSNMEQKRDLFLKTGKKYGTDPLPEECGIDYEKVKLFWKELLDLE